MLRLLQQNEWRIVDQSSLGSQFDALQSFAIDDTLSASVGSGESVPTARAWVHHDTIVLGIQDTKLPYLQEGVSFLQQKGYKVIVRNSGGLAVVLDEGVVNISLIFPEAEKAIDINKGYDAMWELIKQMFSTFSAEIEAREIVGSYCPGSYDLSVGGKKFAGISQRRLRGGVAVQIYLCAFGSGSERAAVLKQFYERSLKGESAKFTYPFIQPEVMASLSELFQANITVQKVMLQLLQTLKKESAHIFSSQLTQSELLLYEHNYQRVYDRNKKALEM